MGQQGQTGQQGQAQQGQAQQGQAGGSVTLTTEQRTKIRQTVLAGGNVPRASNVNFSINVGTVVPTSVRAGSLASFPPASKMSLCQSRRRMTYEKTIQAA